MIQYPHRKGIFFMRKKFIPIIIMLMMVFAMFPMGVKADSGDLYLNELDFNAQINSDGSMHVTEI